MLPKLIQGIKEEHQRTVGGGQDEPLTKHARDIVKGGGEFLSDLVRATDLLAEASEQRQPAR